MIFDRALRKSAKPAVSGMLTLESPERWTGWTSEDAVALSREKAMKLSTVSRCVELRANAMAMLPVYLMNEGTKERPREHPLGPLLWGPPNEAMSRFDYERLMQCNLDLMGNAYAWIDRDSRTGRPAELISLRPDNVTPYLDGAGALWYVYTNPCTGELTRLYPEDVLHYKAYSTDGITGISILSRAAQAISTGLSAQRYQTDLYANGGRPSGVLKTATDLGGSVEILNAAGENETVSKKELIRREWEKVHNGPGKGFRVADVARFFGVPLYLLNAGKQAYSSNEQNSIDFVKHTILPLVVQREQEDSRKLLLPEDQEAGLRIKRELKQLLRGDTAAQAAWYEAMDRIGGYSVDDIRALEDLPAVPGGKARKASLNYVPLEDWAELSRLRALQGKKKEKE